MKASGTCDLIAVDGYTGCPEAEMPMGQSIAYLYVIAEIEDPSPASLPGRLILDYGDGQQLTAEREGNQAYLWLDSPRMDLHGDPWTLSYQADPGVAQSVVYEIEVYPGWIPSYVYADAMTPA